MKIKIKWKNIFFLLLILYIGYIFISQQIIMHNIKEQIAERRTDEQRAKVKNQRLQDEVKMSVSDMYIEKLAREKLGLIKQGETPVINNKN
ncbi:FtsB family cell division protein [Clostridium luticellarii]|nr:septum formation initiator family protein [Clostridium luticellarii]MCI1944589.1 septum formation initiator family protein [Clostridium luticellarii]MCI1968088.1 septum formation initiator family protein [Clostridium luticellarii]MCI1994799.1 septum formation initiator family protein [Clostridium luticellarii]MCI2039031.1 septum formation initiator family protein [Clostridium luticellarii]